jgi:16S rRNA (guanine527-N7)-methyltransferase
LNLIKKYFPRLTPHQLEQFEQLLPLYQEWNSQINVISRKDVDNLYLHHVLHSLAIGKWTQFNPGTRIMDVGCGGGFPGIPLAILFPSVEFHLVDSINKKLKVVNAVAAAIGLENVTTFHKRAEEIKTKYDFVVTRAVAPLPILVGWVKKNISPEHLNALPNGLIALKGGKLDEELKPVKKREYIEVMPLRKIFDEEFYQEKYLIYTQLA